MPQIIKMKYLLVALLVGCTALPSAMRGGSLILRAKIQSGSHTQASVTPYTQSSINHLVLKLYTTNPGESDTGVIRTLRPPYLNSTLTLGGLKVNTSYRLRAFAYATEDESELISLSDATNSCIDFSVESDDRPTMASLDVRLKDRLFDGQVTSSIAITSGGFYNPGSLGASVIGPKGIVTTFAGNGATANADGTGTEAGIFSPTDLTVDSHGNLYVTSSYRVRKITPEGYVSTLAGGDTSASVDGTGASASFQVIRGITLDNNDNLYVMESTSRKIRMITQEGVVTSIPVAGIALNNPTGIVWDGQQYLWISDFGSNRLVCFDPVTREAVTTTITGITRPDGLVLGPPGYLYVVENMGRRIKMVKLDDYSVTIIAGNGFATPFISTTGLNSTFSLPRGIARDSMGYLYVADTGNNRIRRIAPGDDHEVSTLAGSVNGKADGTCAGARFNSPFGLAVDASGTIYVADRYNHCIRKIQ